MCSGFVSETGVSAEIEILYICAVVAAAVLRN